MVVRLRAALRRPQALLAKSIAAWRAASLQVEGASSEVEARAHAGEASKSIDQLS